MLLRLQPRLSDQAANQLLRDLELLSHVLVVLERLLGSGYNLLDLVGAELLAMALPELVAGDEILPRLLSELSFRAAFMVVVRLRALQAAPPSVLGLALCYWSRRLIPTDPRCSLGNLLAYRGAALAPDLQLLL